MFLPGLFGESLFFSSLAFVKTGYTFQSSGLQTTHAACFVRSRNAHVLGKDVPVMFPRLSHRAHSGCFHHELAKDLGCPYFPTLSV